MEQTAEVSPQGRKPVQTPAGEYGVFQALYPSLRRFAAVIADLDTDPDDLVQDALAATLAKHQLHKLDNPAAYLKRAMVNATSDKRRRAGLFRSLLPRLGQDASTIDSYPSDLSFLDDLAPLDRAILYLAEVEGVAHEQIATELKLTPAAVRKRASRARKKLRESLDDDLSPLPEGST